MPTPAPSLVKYDAVSVAITPLNKRYWFVPFFAVVLETAMTSA